MKTNTKTVVAQKFTAEGAIAAERNGIGYNKWVHIDGWSEAVLQYVAAYEASGN